MVLIARGDATGLTRVFDDRYFMASTELNLLNTLLFVSEQDAHCARAAVPPEVRSPDGTSTSLPMHL